MALIQLLTNVTPGVAERLTGSGRPTAANMRQSAGHWFVGRVDGAATRGDLYDDPRWDAAPPVKQAWAACPLDPRGGEWDDGEWPQAGDELRVGHAPHIRAFPFDPSLERPAARIQAAWRDAVSNPARALCRARLLREFREQNGRA